VDACSIEEGDGGNGEGVVDTKEEVGDIVIGAIGIDGVVGVGAEGSVIDGPETPPVPPYVKPPVSVIPPLTPLIGCVGVGETGVVTDNVEEYPPVGTVLTSGPPIVIL
jgi:hypothetical protein